VGLAKQSAGLAKASVGLDKASIISIAKRSKFGDKADASVEIDETPWHAIPDTAFVLTELVSSASEGGWAGLHREVDTVPGTNIQGTTRHAALHDGSGQPLCRWCLQAPESQRSVHCVNSRQLLAGTGMHHP
jgi:hypothetical protein